MRRYYSRRAIASVSIALLMMATIAGAQNTEDILKITRPQITEKENNRTTPALTMDRASAFKRLNPFDISSHQKRTLERRMMTDRESARARARTAAAAPSLQSFGTGGGDIFEREPNGLIAQGVSLPVNIFGEISFDGDVDFFAFQGIAGQQITIEAFAARYRGSQLIADIALFEEDGDLIAVDIGDEDDDPLIRFTPSTNAVLIAGIRDIDDLGGSRMDYMLNITRGVDVDEHEPNGTVAQTLPPLAVTIFGEIDGRSDVDFYSFNATAGQTLIVDVDAEVLGSRLDPEINLSDPVTGIEFFYNDQKDGDDSRFNIVLPYTGRYVIGIGSFLSNSEGFYRLNASLVSASGAPLITNVTKLAKKLIEVTGSGFVFGSTIEVNGRRIKTTFINSTTLQGKVKIKSNKVVTVTSPPDDRRSNPLLAP
ncbi:MAG TPA: PPC domain-containing protein [Blastocatellia bacterium]